MSDYGHDNLMKLIRRLEGRIEQLEQQRKTLPSYTAAARPSAVENTGAMIRVTDAAAGAHIQASNGSSWVALG
jgi:uncharacterized protein with PhoU and TrkA domain